MAQISVLYQQDSIRFDQKQIRYLFKHLGNADAKAVFATAMQHVSDHLSEAERCHKNAHWEDLSTCLTALEEASEQIGMESLQKACGAARGALHTQDAAAIAATVFRLLRIGDRSLSDARLLCDSSG